MPPNTQANQPSNSDFVQISRSEYEALKQPTFTPVVGSELQALSEQDPAKATARDIVWFLLAAMLLISFIFPVSVWITVPAAIFLLLRGKTFFADNSNHSTLARGGTVALKILFIGSAIAGMLFFGGIILIMIMIGAATSGGQHF